MTDSDGSRDNEWAMPGDSVPPQQSPPPPPGYAPPAPPGYAPPGYAPDPAPAYAPPQQPPRPTAGAAQQPTLTYRSWQPGIVALRPLPFGDFITVPFKAMRFNRAVVIGGPLLLFAFSAVLTGLALWIAANDSQLNLFSYYDSFTGVSPSTIIAGVAAVLSWVVSDALATSIVYPGVARGMLGERVSLGAALKAILPRIGHVLLFSVIASIPILVVAGGALAVLVGASSGSDEAFGATILMVLAILFLVVMPLAATITVYSAVARGAILLEKSNAFQAIGRAFRLVPGRFWWSVLIIIVVGMIVGAVQQAFGFVTQIAAFVPGAVLPESAAALGIGFFVGYLFQLVAICITQYSFLGSAYALIYLDMRMRKEGLAFELARAAEARHAARGYAV